MLVSSMALHLQLGSFEPSRFFHKPHVPTEKRSSFVLLLFGVVQIVIGLTVFFVLFIPDENLSLSRDRREEHYTMLTTTSNALWTSTIGLVGIVIGCFLMLKKFSERHHVHQMVLSLYMVLIVVEILLSAATMFHALLALDTAKELPERRHPLSSATQEQPWKPGSTCLLVGSILFSVQASALWMVNKAHQSYSPKRLTRRNVSSLSGSTTRPVVQLVPVRINVDIPDDPPPYFAHDFLEFMPYPSTPELERMLARERVPNRAPPSYFEAILPSYSSIWSRRNTMAVLS